VGIRRAFPAYLQTRFKHPDHGGWMPGLWADLECRQEDLSEYIWQATKPHRLDLEKLGFTVCRYLKPTKSLNPNLRDSGGISYLDSTRRFFAQVLYHRMFIPAAGTIQNSLIITFTAVYENGTLSCTNNRKAFAPLEDSLVIRMNSYDVGQVYHEFQSQVQRRTGQPREFPTLESLRRWFDDKQVRTFEKRVRRRLFVPMSEQQVQAAKNRLQGHFAAPTAGPPKIVRTASIWGIIIATALTLTFLPRARRESSYTLTYQGQQFKMAKPYATYEDYKDDPDNLDTNEFPRIELAMTSADVPTTFKDRKQLIDLVGLGLEFPGYGLGIATATNTDDGSTLELDEIEIPHRDKSRYLVVHESPNHLVLIDDFVAGTATNAVKRVKLESATLRYYDDHGVLVRQKLLDKAGWRTSEQ
jgi:hypothetical protein